MSGSRSPAARCRSSRLAPASSRASRAARHTLPAPFADRLAALVDERRSQVCLGLDPDPSSFESRPQAGVEPAEAAADAIARRCESLIEATAALCVAVKPQLACFERLGAPGWAALARVVEASRAAGLLVVADGKRGDVPVSATAYAQGLFGPVPTAWGEAPGLSADAATVNPLIGGDALEPLIDAAATAGGGLFALVRTSNPGAADILDLETPDGPLHERLATMVAERSGRLVGESGLTGMGAVVGATEPGHLARLRQLMPDSIFLTPGVGAQGGSADALGPAFAGHPASVLVPASRSIAGADDPAAAASDLREAVWAASQHAAR